MESLPEETGLEKLPDKTLHCLARIIQDLKLGQASACLYCKYAVRCSESIITDLGTGSCSFKNVMRFKIEHELKKLTDVNTTCDTVRDTKYDICIEGSWLEGYPGLAEELAGMPARQRTRVLSSPDILECIHKLDIKKPKNKE